MNDILFKDIGSLTSLPDLRIENGDFVVGNSEQQETALIIITSIGNWFEFPLVGVGIINYLASNESPLVIEQKIKTQMETDGFKVENISTQGSTLTNYKINVNAKRKT